MRLMLVHPSALMYSEIFLRLEPLGLEVRAVDLQVDRGTDLNRELAAFRPDALGVSLNYLANIPEAIDLAHRVKVALPGCFVFFGGHSVSFIASYVLDQAGGAVDAVLRGEGETAIVPLLAAVRDGGLKDVQGAVTADGLGSAPRLLESIDSPRPPYYP
jgi:hopanoid C-3 methylase